MHLDLDAFATMLESSGEIKRMTLYDIKKELTHQFADIRTKYTDPSPNGTYTFSFVTSFPLCPPSLLSPSLLLSYVILADIFRWLTGETDETLAIGVVVAARAFRQTERSVLCRLERYFIRHHFCNLHLIMFFLFIIIIIFC